MKTIYIIVTFLFMCIFTSAQDKLDSPLIEIFTLVEDPSPNPTGSYSFTLSAIGTAWKAIRTSSQYYYEYDISSEVLGGTVYPIVNAPYYQYTGFNYPPNGDHSYPEFGFGLYKLQSSTSNYIYLDYRDTRYGFYSYCTGHCADIWVKYDVSTQELYLKSSGSYEWSDAIPDGTYLKIWDIKGQGAQEVSVRVDDFWINCLVLIPTTTNHPRLVWGPHPTFNATHYRIYSAVSNSPSNPLSLNYFLISTVNASTFEYTDYAVTILPGYQYAYYYVVGWNGSSESTKTNYVSTPAEFHKQLSYEIPKKYNLSQNYPNQFNPSTIINYSVKDAGLV